MASRGEEQTGHTDVSSSSMYTVRRQVAQKVVSAMDHTVACARLDIHPKSLELPAMSRAVSHRIRVTPGAGADEVAATEVARGA